MTKNQILSLGLLLSVAGCDREIHKASSEIKEVPQIVLSCEIQHTGYRREGRNHYDKPRYTTRTLVYIKPWSLSAEKPLGWAITFENGDFFIPGESDPSKEEGPSYFTRVKVSDFEIAAEAYFREKVSAMGNDTYTKLKINRATGVLESVSTVNKDKLETVTEMRGLCQKAEQKF